MQELTTDEAVVGWNDGTIKDLHGQVWTSGNEFIRTMYSRIFYQIAQTNEFLRQTTDEKQDLEVLMLKLKVMWHHSELRPDS